MPKHRLGMSRWLDGMGFKHADAPPLIESIQPVQIISDARAQVSPLVGSVGLGGTNVTAAAAQFPWLQVRQFAEGGAFVKLQTSSDVDGIFSFGVVPIANAITLGNLVSFTFNQLNPEFPTVSQGEMGDFAINLALGSAGINVLAGNSAVVEYNVPANSALVCSFDQAAALFVSYVEIHEFPGATA